MLTDRYGLPLSTASAAARDAHVEGCDLALTFYPGAAPAYDRAIAADPGFALAYAGKAQVLMREGNVAAARRPWRQPKTRPSVYPSARPVTSHSSTLSSLVGPTPRSPPCTHIWRHGHATRWSLPVPQTPTA
jgi:hypothetical protein